IIRGTKERTQCTAPRTLTFHSQCQSSRVLSQAAPLAVTPALANTSCGDPNVSSTRAARASTAAESATSVRTARTPPNAPAAGAAATLVAVDAPSTNGMASETILLAVEWDDGGRQRERLVVRLSPDAAAVPVFPTYDLDKQFRVMQLVGERSPVPVPPMRWHE